MKSLPPSVRKLFDVAHPAPQPQIPVNSSKLPFYVILDQPGRQVQWIYPSNRRQTHQPTVPSSIITPGGTPVKFITGNEKRRNSTSSVFYPKNSRMNRLRIVTNTPHIPLKINSLMVPSPLPLKPLTHSIKASSPLYKMQNLASYLPIDNTKYKTMLCKEFTSTNNCKFGGGCTFAHGLQELRSKPITQYSHPKSGLFKTALCDRFMEQGVCSYGPECKFAHGHNELLPRKPREFQSPIKYQQNDV